VCVCVCVGVCVCVCVRVCACVMLTRVCVSGAVVCDVRSKEQFASVRFPQSFHFNTHKLDDSAVVQVGAYTQCGDEDCDICARLQLERSRGRPLIIVGSRSDDVSEAQRRANDVCLSSDRARAQAYRFANKLVQLGFAHVSVLHGGVDALVADCNHLLVRGK
jgi:rhodanese-related sulfurtransferase